MAAMLRSASGSMSCALGLRRLSHVMALPPPLDGVIHHGVSSPPCVLPEFNQNRDNNNIGFGLDFSSFPYGGSMELMAVPKKKVPSESSVIIITSVSSCFPRYFRVCFSFSLSLFFFFFFFFK
jgi:hypothetical protein